MSAQDYPLTIDFVVSGRDVILVEDIVDEGYTLSYLLNNLESRGAASVQSCALIDKPFPRAVDVRPDYVGLQVPADGFLVGYGLDFQEHFRNLPHFRKL